MAVTTIGSYIVLDPDICHGKPTFRDTRIMVSQVLDQVARGMSWELIESEWRGKVPRAAISEAVYLANQVLNEHFADHLLEPA